MSDAPASNCYDDPFGLTRFVEAQKCDFERALAEIRSGRKRTHWMWYIFPQFDGLGLSSTAGHYSIKSIDEAKAYLEHAVLGPRLLACMDAAIAVNGHTAEEIFGNPEYLKLRSCATLFACVQPAGSVFHRLLDKFYGGESDARTLEILGLGINRSRPIC